MNDFTLFLISPVVFESKEEDPFGFDDLSRRIASKYIPFSGTVRKPIYFLFVAYVKWLLQNELAEYRSNKNKKQIRLRLEKLLVLTWKHSNKNLKGRNVIGNSLRAINPFRGNDGNWVVQNCFKIYGSAASDMGLKDLVADYWKCNRREPALIKNFLEEEGHLNSVRERHLKVLLNNLRKGGKNSLFRGKDVLPYRFSRKFMTLLRSTIKDKSFGEDHELIRKLFTAPSRADSLLRGVLKSSKYPFKVFNSWFSSFVIAVDADLNKTDSKSLWEEADKYFGQIRISDRHESLKNARPSPKCWFVKTADGYAADDDFDESAWDAMVRRAESDDRFYSRFRTDALASLLKELSHHEK